jgi:EamA domain-containing membrane protein RarD
MSAGVWCAVGAYAAWGLLPIVDKEPFTRVQFVGFSLVWAALIVFGFDGAAARRATA